MGASCCAAFADSSGLGCCMDMDAYKEVDLAEVVPNERRHCTDVPCCCIFLAAILLEVIIAVYSWQSGANPHLITDGYDYQLNMCELVVWPSITEYNIRICMDENASCNDFTNDPNNNMMIDTYPSKQFLNSYCIPHDLNELAGTEYEQNFDSTQQTFEHALVDLETTKWLVIIMSFVAILLSFIYVKIIACIGRFLVWFTGFVIIAGGCVLAYYLIDSGIDNLNDVETATMGQWQIGLACAVIVILIILILIIFFERKNIDLVVEMLKEASHAMSQLPATLCAPIYFSIIVLLFTFGWCLEFAYIYSVKVEVGPNEMPPAFVNNGNYSDEYWYLTFDPIMETALIWHVVIWMFIIQFILYTGFMTLAGVFARWYFSEWSDVGRKKKDLKQSCLICRSFCTLLRYHLGSIAFAALILTLIRVIRGCVTYLESKVAGAASPLAKCCFACVSCCLWCCQWIFDKINKNGLIFVTIYGHSFCYSSYSSFKLVLEHLDSSIMVQAVATSSEILGKFMITLGLTAISVVCMANIEYYKNNLSSYLFPAVVIMIICYLVSSLFMSVFEVAVETIYLSYLIDEKVHDGTPVFATGELSRIKRRVPSMRNVDASDYMIDSEEDHLTAV